MTNGRGLYRFWHQCLMWGCIVHAFLYGIIVVVAANDAPETMFAGVAMLNVAVGGVLPGCFVWTREFSKHDATLDL